MIVDPVLEKRQPPARYRIRRRLTDPDRAEPFVEGFGKGIGEDGQAFAASRGGDPHGRGKQRLADPRADRGRLDEQQGQSEPARVIHLLDGRDTEKLAALAFRNENTAPSIIASETVKAASACRINPAS